MLYNVPVTPSTDIRTDSDLHEAFLALRAGARECEPNSWWLSQTELTTLGYEAIVREVADSFLAEHPDGEPILLEWGAGPGFTTYLFERLGLSCVYYDFKYERPSYDWVHERLASPQVFIGEDATGLPFDDESFDAATSCGVLEHVPDPSASLRELFRVLKPGGGLYIYHFPNRYSYTEVLAGLIGQANHPLRWSRRRLVRELRDAGFELVWFDYRYMIPRNLVRFPRVRRFFSAHAEGLYSFDRALSRIPVLNATSNALNCYARKPLR